MNNVTIVMYHYVRDLKRSKYPSIKGLDVSLFIEQIEYFKKKYNILSIEEVIYSIDNRSRLPDNVMLLTFDDAYSDHYQNVFPVLEKYKLHGSFYVPVKAITENIVLDVNKIHFILASVESDSEIMSDLNDLIKNYSHSHNLKSFEYYYEKLAKATRYDTKNIIFIKRLLQVELIEELRLKFADILFNKYVSNDECAFSRELYMSEEQLYYMLKSGMHVGNHGYNHYWWNSLNEQELKKELRLSNNFLNKIGIDKDNWTACYPYGAYNEQTINILKESGCKISMTTEVNMATTDEHTRFIMPRFDTNDFLEREV